MLFGVWMCFATGNAQIRTEVVGWLENSYLSNGSGQDPLSSPSYSEYLQTYQLGIKGFVLSTNFLTYYLGTRLEESQKQSGGSSWRTRNFDWYDFTGNFLRNRRVAFDLYLRRRQTDIFLPGGLNRRFEDLVGTDVHIRTGWLPRTRIGYRLIRSNDPDAGIYQTHQTTVYMLRGAEHTQVEGSFRDEQRMSPNLTGVDRLQELKLKGTADIWGESTELSGDVNYTSRNTYRTFRSSLRLLGNYRRRDRLFVIYSFNNSQTSSYLAYHNAFRGEYRRYITQPLALALRSDLQRTLSKYADLQASSDREDIAAGFEYLDYKRDSLNVLNKSGYLFLKYQHSNQLGAALGGDANAFLEYRKEYSSFLQMTYSWMTTASYLRYPDYVPYSFSNRYIHEVIVRPVSGVLLDNRVTLSNVEGTYFQRFVEERGEITLSPLRRLSFNSAVILNIVLQPFFRETLYWNNRLQWGLRRNLLWTTHSSWNYNRQLNTRSFWVESLLDYRMRKLQFQLRVRDEIRTGEDLWTVFASLSRTIGSGVEVR